MLILTKESIQSALEDCGIVATLHQRTTDLKESKPVPSPRLTLSLYLTQDLEWDAWTSCQITCRTLGGCSDEAQEPAKGHPVGARKKQEKGNNICKERQLVRCRMEVRYWKDPQKWEQQSACPLLNQVFKSTLCVLAITLTRTEFLLPLGS